MWPALRFRSSRIWPSRIYKYFITLIWFFDFFSSFFSANLSLLLLYCIVMKTSSFLFLPLHPRWTTQHLKSRRIVGGITKRAEKDSIKEFQHLRHLSYCVFCISRAGTFFFLQLFVRKIHEAFTMAKFPLFIVMTEEPFLLSPNLRFAQQNNKSISWN